jgi:hypothetical protein
MTSRVVLAIAALLLPFLSAATPATALDIFSEVVDLADPEPGGDLWRYRRDLASPSLKAEHSSSIAIHPGPPASPPAPGADWDAIVLQPGPSVPNLGVYDALALVDAPDTTVPFLVDFIWSGEGEPDIEPPLLLHAASLGSLDSAGASVPVPEPNTGLLLALGLAGLGARRRHSHSLS